MYNHKIVIPEGLKKRTVEWYHTYFLHPGINHMRETIRQHFWWNEMHHDINNHLKCCDSCQWLKKQKKKYGYLPMKEAEYKPWERLCKI